MTRTFALILAATLVSARLAVADCGSIPFKPGVKIFEPNQRAVIAFDGRTEILLLSTDLRASEPTKVLEVIPLPSEPTVKEGDVEVFKNATRLINQRVAPKKFGAGKMAMGGGAFGDAAPPAGEVTFHEKIGAQDISVVRVLDSRRFIHWVEEYLRKSGVDNPVISEPIRRVVAEYLRDRFKWFVFNVVELGPKTVTKQAVQYRFATRKLYYPLRITRAESGETTVRLILITPRLVEIPNLRPATVRLMHQPVKIYQSELKELDEDLHELLGNRQWNLLRIWEIKGRLSGFRRDVLTGWH